MPYDVYENSKPLSEQQQDSNTVEMQKIEEPKPKPQINQEEFVKGLVMKHLPAIKEFVRDLEPADRDFVYQLVEAKYPGYSSIAKMIIGNGNGNHESQDEEYPESGYPEDKHPEDSEEPEPDMDADILNEVADYAGKLYLGGFNWTQISDMLYRKYDVDWHPIRVQNIVLKRLAWQNTRTKEVTTKKDEPKPVITKEPHRGIIRKIWHWIW